MSARIDRDGAVSLLCLTIPCIAAFAFFFPGYFQADHQTTIAKIATGIPSQWHSLTWGYLAFPLIYHSPHYSCYGIVQLIVFVLCTYCCAARLKQLGLLRWSTPFCAFFGLFPTYVLYNLLWGTDLCFAYAFMILTTLLIELCVLKEEALRDTSFCLRFALALLVATLLRKNAILINAVLCILLPCTYRSDRMRTLLICVVPTAIALLIDNFFFPVVIGATPSASQELLSVPSEQIARVYLYDGDIPADVDAILTKDRTAEEWADSYLTYCADLAKKDRELTPEFLGAWARLGLRNPQIYLDAYKELMHPYWTFGRADGYKYGIGFTTDFDVHEDFTLRYADQLRKGYVEQFDGEGAKSHQFLWPRRLEKWVDKRLPVPLRIAFYTILFNRGLPLVALLAGALLSLVAKRGRDYLIIALPSICVMMSLYVFAPVASFRYLLSCYYALPIIMLVFPSWFSNAGGNGSGRHFARE